MMFNLFEQPVFPYLQAGPWQVGAYSVEIFGLMVWLGLLIGVAVCLHRGTQQGLDLNHINRVLLWGLSFGFVISHAVYFWVYHPGQLPRDLTHLLNVFDGMSSIGGLLGFFLGMGLYIHWKKLEFFQYADVVMWATVHGWIIARTGCAFAHDHPGIFTGFWFSVQWPLYHPDQRFNLTFLPGRHDLGLYEMLLTVAILILLYITNARGQRFPGYTIALTFCIFAPVRFGLDFLRVNDIRYADLTPAQYVTIVMFLFGLTLFFRKKRKISETS